VNFRLDGFVHFRSAIFMWYVKIHGTQEYNDSI
jgi:hypothetical protein